MVSLSECLYSAFIPGVLKGQKTVLYTPELELQTVVGYHMGARTEHGPLKEQQVLITA